MQKGELWDAMGNREPPAKAAKGDGKRFPTQQGPASSSSGSGGWQSSWDQQTWKEYAKDLGRKCDAEDRRQEDRKWKDPFLIDKQKKLEFLSSPNWKDQKRK
jgi:hypothetical protein